MADVTPENPSPRSVLEALQGRQTHRRKIQSGRSTILAVAILTFIGGIAMYFIGRSQVEAEIAKVEQQIAPLSAERRAAFEREVLARSGMTWEQAVATDRGRVTMLLVTNLMLSVLYVGLWLWAKRNALGAALVALAVFVTVVVGSALYDPTTLAQGVFVKIAVIVGLLSAVSSAFKYRRLAGVEAA